MVYVWAAESDGAKLYFSGRARVSTVLASAVPIFTACIWFLLPVSIPFREYSDTLFPAISVVFLCLLAMHIVKRLTGDALVGQRRLLIDSGGLGAGWRHAVSLGRWLWRFRMARHVCRDERVGFDAP